MMTNQKVAVVTGSSSGMGYETSLILARNGFFTYATMRKLEGEGKSKQLSNIAKDENLPLEIIQLDVNSDKSVTDAIIRIAKEKDGRLDIVVNNAGYDLMGALEETSIDEIKAQFETNFFGAVRVMQAVIPIMREQKSGKIVNITSLGGRISFPLNSAYHATKFALEGLSESVQYELEPFGIKIIIVEPGGVGSNFLKNLKWASKASDPSNFSYRSIQASIIEFFKQWAQNLTHPSEVAKVILKAVTSDNPDFRYVVGNDAVTTLEARRKMSDREFQNMMMKQINQENVTR
jgi:NAD(P)-dependent dehydrogenase (short-subunit alcohol dehydrogenase family)